MLSVTPAKRSPLSAKHSFPLPQQPHCTCHSRFYVERSVGFVGYDVDRGCFMTGAPLWIPAFAGMTKKDQSPRSHRFLSFPQNALRHSRKTHSVIPRANSRKTHLSFPAKRTCHSRKRPPSFPQNAILSFPQNAPVMTPARLRGTHLSFPQNALRHSRKTLRHSRKMLSRKTKRPRHSREGGNPLGITVIHTGVLFLNQPNLPCLPIFSGDSM